MNAISSIVLGICFMVLIGLLVELQFTRKDRDEAQAMLSEVGNDWMECSSDLGMYKNLDCAVVSETCCEQCYDALSIQTYRLITDPACVTCNAELNRVHLVQ